MNTDEKVLKKSSIIPHCVTVDGREKMTVSGVEDVENFDESAVTMITSEGNMNISGEGLHIEHLNVDSGDLIISGHINAVEYVDNKRQKGGFFSRLFG